MKIIQPVKPPRNDDPKERERFYREVALRLSYITLAGNPTGSVTPRWIGDNALDTSNTEWYRSTGTTVADWEITT